MNFPSNLRFESLSGSTGFYVSCNDAFIIWNYPKFFEITYLQEKLCFPPKQASNIFQLDIKVINLPYVGTIAALKVCFEKKA